MKDKLLELKKVKWVKPKEALVSLLWVLCFTIFLGLFIFIIDRLVWLAW